MSNVSGVPSYTPPAAPDYTSPVVAKIESQIGKISDLYQEISSIMREIAGLKPPDPITRNKDESDESWAARLQQFNSAMADFQSRLNALNSRLHSAQGKLARAQMVLNRLQNSELPNAQRKEANEIQENMRRAQKALEDGVRAAEEMSRAAKSDEEGGSTEGSRVELRALEKKVQVEATFEGASLKELVSMFSLMVAMQASPDKVHNRFTKMPSPAGSGLPPIGTA